MWYNARNRFSLFSVCTLVVLLIQCQSVIDPDKGRFHGEQIFTPAHTGWNLKGQEKTCTLAPIPCTPPYPDDIADFVQACTSKKQEVYFCACADPICTIKIKLRACSPMAGTHVCKKGL